MIEVKRFDESGFPPSYVHGPVAYGPSMDGGTVVKLEQTKMLQGFGEIDFYADAVLEGTHCEKLETDVRSLEVERSLIPKRCGRNGVLYKQWLEVGGRRMEMPVFYMERSETGPMSLSPETKLKVYGRTEAEVLENAGMLGLETG